MVEPTHTYSIGGGMVHCTPSQYGRLATALAKRDATTQACPDSMLSNGEIADRLEALRPVWIPPRQPKPRPPAPPIPPRPRPQPRGVRLDDDFRIWTLYFLSWLLGLGVTLVAVARTWPW